MKKAFALIYALILTATLLLVISTVAVSLVSDIKLTNQSRISTQAYDMARSGISDGWAQYRLTIKNANAATQPSSPNWPMGDIIIPSGACDATPDYNFYYNDGTGYKDTKDATPSPLNYPTLTAFLAAHSSTQNIIKQNGFYAYKVCAKNTNTDAIMATGYYAGQKISLEADVKHGTGDYSQDRIKIYQTNN